MTSKRNKSARALSRREMLAGSAGLSFAFALGAPSLFGESDALAQAAGRLNAYVADRQGRHHHDHVAGARDGAGRSTPRCR